MNIINLFASSNYLVVNKALVKKIGLNETILLSELASEYQYYLDNKLEEIQNNNGFFYSTLQNIEDRTTLKRKVQDSCIKTLKEYGILETKNIGIPCKRYFKINQDKLLFVLEGQSSLSLESKLDCPSGTTKNNNKNNNKDISFNLENEFEDLWSMYPKKKGKANALKKYAQYRSKDRAIYDRIKNGIKEYCKDYFRNHNSDDLQYMKDGSTFFNQKVWEDYEVYNDVLNATKEIVIDQIADGVWEEFDYDNYGF